MRDKRIRRDDERKEIEGLPVEILLEIFKYLDICDSLCLALASPHIYPIYKSETPFIPNLWTKIQFVETSPYSLLIIFNSRYLGDSLKTWIGPDYQPVTSRRLLIARFIEPDISHLPPFFVLKRKFRSERKTRSLINRYKDFSEAEDKAKFMLPQYRQMLPHPRNKGSKWYVEARAAMVRESSSFESYNDWHAFWSRHLLGTMSRRTKLQVWEEFCDKKLLEEFPEAKQRGKLEKMILRYGIYLRMKKVPYGFACDLSDREAWYNPRQRGWL